jgi:rhodanese-related sulfurtransferase
MVRNVSRQELKEKMDRGEEFFLVDTLEEPYYRHSHLPGAINIPLKEIERAPEVLPDKGVEIVVYCMDPPCEISEKAARKLEAMDYDNVRHYEGGKQDWFEAGLPAEGRKAEREGS